MKQVVKPESIDDYIGYHPPATAWHRVTQEQINQFADCTLDHQPIHVDPHAARQGPFGVTIAHGFLTLSLLSHFAKSYGLLIEGAHTFINYGFDKIRFLAPVKVNARIRASATVISIEEKSPGQFLTRVSVAVEVENEEKPALIAEWLTMQIC